MLRKLILPCLAVLLLAGCAGPADNHLYLTPTITLPSQDPSMGAISIVTNAVDERSDLSVAKPEEDGKIVSLMSSPEARLLLLDALEKQMRARGYMIDVGGNVKVTIKVNELFANIQQGSFRYLITTKAKISVIVQTPTGGNITKTFSSVTTREGAMNAKRTQITNALNDTLSSVIKAMADDMSVHEFIKQNSR